MTSDAPVAIVTGSAGGIGESAARALAARGHRLIIADIQAEAAEATAARMRSEGITADAVHVDVTQPPSAAALVERTMARHGRIDVLVNNAGIESPTPFLDITLDTFDRVMRVNTTSVWICCQAVIPVMLRQGKGSIVNMSSGASSIKGAPNRFVYGTTKAAVIGLTKALAADHVRQGIRANSICPGTVDTPSLKGRIDAFTDPVQARKDFIARQPMGRLGTAEEIAELALFLASDASSFITGAEFKIDGGWSL